MKSWIMVQVDRSTAQEEGGIAFGSVRQV